MALPADVIGNILVYACESPRDTAARRWCPSKAWLEAYEAPALWRTLTLSTLPTARAHCAMSAWVRAPQRLRRAVERHTREVVVNDSTADGWREKSPTVAAAAWRDSNLRVCAWSRCPCSTNSRSKA